jgi:hypothetical protein
MTKITTIPNADAKVSKTVLGTMNDIHTMLANTGAEPNEVRAMSAIFSGVSIADAAAENGLAVEGETTANTVNRFRNRMATIMIAAFKNIARPVAEIVSAERNAEKNAENEAKLADQLAAWEASGGRGRKPGEGNRPKSEIALEKAHAEARRLARENLSIPAQGRIAPDMQEKYVREFEKLYTKALTNIGKKYADEITLDETKIEKMVKRGIKDLKVSATAQKAVKGKTAKGKKGETVAETEAPTEDAEVPSTETADEKVQA